MDSQWCAGDDKVVTGGWTTARRLAMKEFGSKQRFKALKLQHQQSFCSSNEISGEEVFLDVSINDNPTSWIVITLFEKDAPTGGS